MKPVYLRIIIFNILIVFLLLAAVFVPVVLFENIAAGAYLRMVAPMGIIVLLSIAGLDIYFWSNRRLVTLLAREDWPALADYLETKVFTEGRYASRDIRILAQAWLVQGKFADVARLEAMLAAGRPALLEEHALIFGAARVLSVNVSGGSYTGAAGFFRERLEKSRSARDVNAEWLRLYYGFSLMMAQSPIAAGIFGELAEGARDIIVAGLSAFFLSEHAGNAVAVAGRSRVRTIVKTAGNWEKKTAKLKAEVHGAIIRKYLDEAGAWVFGGQS